MNFKHFVLGAFLGIVALAILVLLNNMSAPSIDPEYVFKGEIEKVFSSPEELVETYNKEETKEDAETKYTGKGVMVRGEVSEEDISPLKLITADGYVECYFPKKDHGEILGKIKQGSPVTIQGRCRGMKRPRVVELDGCKLIDGPPMPPFQHPPIN